MADMDDRREKAKLVLAERLRTLQAAGFLDFEDVVRHLEVSGFIGHCVTKLAKAIGFDKIYGDLYEQIQTSKDAMLDVWKQALLNETAFAEALLSHIPRVKWSDIFEPWLTKPERATWEQLVNASPYAVLRARAAEGDKRADEAMADAPEATVVEEEVVEEIEPSDSRPPWPNHE